MTIHSPINPVASNGRSLLTPAASLDSLAVKTSLLAAESMATRCIESAQHALTAEAEQLGQAFQPAQFAIEIQSADVPAIPFAEALTAFEKTRAARDILNDLPFSLDAEARQEAARTECDTALYDLLLSVAPDLRAVIKKMEICRAEFGSDLPDSVYEWHIADLSDLAERAAAVAEHA